MLITNKDQTKTGFFQLDYNHAFNAAGSHLLKGGVGVRHTTNEVEYDLSRAATCSSTGARRSSTTAAQTGTGTYGYYEVNDRGTRGEVDANMPSLYVQDTWTIGNRLTLNLGVRTEKRDDPVVPARHQGRPRSSSASARRSRRASARPTTCSATAG